MKIFATNKFKGSLDLSSKEDFHNKNPIEKLPFRVTIKSGQTITVDDKWYTLHSIQSALKIGYIEILDFKEQHELVTSGPYKFVRHPIYTGISANSKSG